jgi:hypothetical protein
MSEIFKRSIIINLKPRSCLTCGSNELLEKVDDYRKSQHFFCKSCYELKKVNFEINKLKAMPILFFSKVMRLKPKNYWIINKIIKENEQSD